MADRTGQSRRSLGTRLVVVLVALLAVTAVATGAVSTLGLRASLLDQLDERLAATSTRALGAGPGQGGPGGPPPPGLDVPGQAAGTLGVTVVDGVVRSGYIEADGARPTLTTAQEDVLLAVPADDVPRTVDVPGRGAYRVRATTTDDGGLVVTGLSTDALDRTVTEFVAVEVVVVAVALVLAGVAGHLLVRRELRPLRRVAATARHVTDLPLHEGEVVLGERVPATDTDPGTEVGQVGGALNRMLDHVEDALAVRHRSEQHLRQFLADASHELRTPLASVRGHAELARRVREEVPPDVLRSLARVESEARRMSGLVEDMLLLARLDTGRPLDVRPVDLALLAADATVDAHAAGPDHTWLLDLPDLAEGDDPGGREADDDAPATVVRGDEDRLRQVLANLLTNARVHTPPGTTVTTAVRVPPEDPGTVEVLVRDDGPGIPADLLGSVLDRFTRGDGARTRSAGSSGLGLAIVDAVVRAHGGRVDVTSAAADDVADVRRGTTVTVRVPR